MKNVRYLVLIIVLFYSINLFNPKINSSAFQVNYDLSLNSIILFKAHMLGINNIPSELITDYDLNLDNKLDIKDLTIFTKYILGEKVIFGGEEETTQINESNIDQSSILEEKGVIHIGEATFYGGGYEGGCAMLDPVSRDDYWIVAMNLADYNNAMLAGAYIEVTGVRGTINMLVTDLLPEGKKGDLDLFVDAFPLVANPIDGRVPISWRIIPLDSAENTPVMFKYKEGSSEFWCGVQIRNHRYPIYRVEYLNSKGIFEELPRRHYNYFESNEMGGGPYTFKITDIYGQVIIEKDIPLIMDTLIEGQNQFPK